MAISMVEKVEDDIKTSLNAETGFLQPNFTFYSLENDDDEDADLEFAVPNIIYGIEAVPIDYFMDGSRIMSTDITFTVNISEFNTISVSGDSLTRKRLINYALDKLQKTLDDMTFSGVTDIEHSVRLGEASGKVPIGEDEFLYRGTVTMSVTFTDSTT